MTDQKNQQKGSVLFLLKGVSIGSLFWLTAPGFLFLLVSSAELISRDKGYKESNSSTVGSFSCKLQCCIMTELSKYESQMMSRDQIDL